MSTNVSVEDKISTVHKLKEVITHFSEELHIKASAKEEVTVAGKLVEAKQVNDEFYALTLDDYIGETRVLLSLDTYHHFQSILHIDSLISVQGFVNVVSRVIQGKSKTEYSVVGFDVKLLSF